MTFDYDNLPERIVSIYNSCSAQEQMYLLKILEELSITGESETYERVWLADFKEVPVSIDTFICDSMYLGEINRNGEAVYPFWRETLRDIFNNGNKYNEIILSGATRIGKTSTAVLAAAYMTYRLMLYKNPHEYFKKKAVSRFTIGFAGLTKDLAMGVSYREYNDTLKASEWFNEHGKFSRSDKNFYYIPEGDKIDIVAASDGAHLLGMQLWHCLVGDTDLVTVNGPKKLSEVAGSTQRIFQIDNEGNLLQCDASVVLTQYVCNTIRITLRDGSVLEGTPEHKVLLDDGSYKMLSELSLSSSIRTLIEYSICTFSKVCKIETIGYEFPIPVFDVINAGQYHNFAVYAGKSIVFAHNCTIDEINFSKAGVKDINIAKSHMKKLYDIVNARISGTFRIGGEVYGKLVAASSKNTDSDFLSDHIEKQLNTGNEHLYLVDKPQWEILPKSMFSDKKFYFTVGDRFKRGFVVPPENEDEMHLQEYRDQGYQVIAAPAELRKNFLADYDISLRDIAGISVVGSMGFITQESITPNVSTNRANPFFTDTIAISNKDSQQIYDYFRADVVPARFKKLMMNIHLDLAEVSDRQGICGVVQDGTKIIELDNGKKVMLPYLRQVFVVGVEAPQGQRMSLQKVINFIFWLRKNGFNINLVSTDQYQSSYVREVLAQQGFGTQVVSVDRSMEPYLGLRNLIADQRIELVKCQLQEDELVNLQRTSNKIDHKPEGSKDLSDALCGACFTLIGDKTPPPLPSKSVASAIAAVNGKKNNPANAFNQRFGVPGRFVK